MINCSGPCFCLMTCRVAQCLIQHKNKPSHWSRDTSGSRASSCVVLSNCLLQLGRALKLQLSFSTHPWNIAIMGYCYGFVANH